MAAAGDKERHALRPLWSQKLKAAFYQFHPIDLLEEEPKCEILAFTLLLPLLWLQKMADKIGLKLRNCHFGPN